MNRKALLIISLFVFITFSQTTIAQNKDEYDILRDELRGKVKSVNEKHYEEKRIFFGLIPIKEEFSDKYMEFNKDRNIIYENKQSNKVGYRDIIFFKYNERGNCVELIGYQYKKGKKDEKCDHQNNYEYIYNEKGNITEMKTYFYNKLLYTSYYKYDEKGNCIEELNKKPEDSTFTKYIFTLNSNGNMILFESYNSLGIYGSKIIYTLDDKGNTIKSEWFLKDNIKPHETLYIYNIKGNVIMEISYNNFKNYYYANIFKYKYDSRGNWIKKTEYNEEGKIVKITKRKIEYYND
ncbi:MAG: hypothetical protein PHG98_06945 [Bacteroidales bacterium]|nr:hypothetical protein [Bacteroidales bacterium]